MFVPGRHFQPSLMLVGNARCFLPLSGALKRCLTKLEWASSAHFHENLKDSLFCNSVTFYSNKWIITLDYGVNAVDIFSTVIYNLILKAA